MPHQLPEGARRGSVGRKIGRGRRGEGASERESTSAKCHWAPDSHTHVHKHMHACTHPSTHAHTRASRVQAKGTL